MCSERVVGSVFPLLLLFYSGQSDSKDEPRAAPSIFIENAKSWTEFVAPVAMTPCSELFYRLGKFFKASRSSKRLVIWHPEGVFLRDRKSLSMSTINVLFTPWEGFTHQNVAINTRSMNTTCEWIIKHFMSRIKINHRSDHDTKLTEITSLKWRKFRIELKQKKLAKQPSVKWSRLTWKIMHEIWNFKDFLGKLALLVAENRRNCNWHAFLVTISSENFRPFAQPMSCGISINVKLPQNLQPFITGPIQ